MTPKQQRPEYWHNYHKREDAMTPTPLTAKEKLEHKLTQELITLRDTFRKIANGHDNDFAKWANVIDKHLSLQPPPGQNPVVKDGSKAGHVGEVPTHGGVAPTNSPTQEQIEAEIRKWLDPILDGPNGERRIFEKDIPNLAAAILSRLTAAAATQKALEIAKEHLSRSCMLDAQETLDKINELTPAAGVREWRDFSEVQQAYVERKIELAKLDERERCARVADDFGDEKYNDKELEITIAIAAAIRARKDSTVSDKLVISPSKMTMDYE